MKKAIIFLFLLAVTNNIFSQVPEYSWMKSIGSNEDDAGYFVSADNDGNIFLAGSFSDTADFGGQEIIGQGYTDAFLAKYDSLGNLLWVTGAGGVTTDKGMAVDFDSENNIYFIGTFHSPIFYIGDTIIYSCGCSDFTFVSKFNSSGEFLWAHSFQGDGSTPAKDIVISNSGNVYVFGNFFNTTYFGTDEISPNGSSDVFIAEFTSSGEYLRVKTYGGAGADDLISADDDALGNLFITGYFGKKVVFDNDTLDSAGENDIFLIKLDENLNTQIAKSFGGTGDDQGMGIDVNEQGNVVISGTFYETADFESINITATAYYDMFIAQTDADLNLNWVKSFGGGFDDFARSISSDGFGNIYATGDFMLTADFIDTTVVTGTYPDAFVLKLDDEGNTLWAKQIGGSRHDYGNSGYTTGENQLLLTGSFTDSLSYDGLIMYGYGAVDAYFAKLSPSEIISVYEVIHSEHFIIYPVPAKERIYIKSNAYINYIELYNLQGIRILQAINKSVNNEFNISGVKSGHYILKAKTGNGTIIRKSLIII